MGALAEDKLVKIIPLSHGSKTPYGSSIFQDSTDRMDSQQKSEVVSSRNHQRLWLFRIPKEKMSWDTNSVGFVVVFSTNQLMVDGILLVTRLVNVGGYSIGCRDFT